MLRAFSVLSRRANSAMTASSPSVDLASTARFARGACVAGGCTGTRACGGASAWDGHDGRTLLATLMSTPVATTDTRMIPSRLSSKVAPTMMLAVGLRTRAETSGRRQAHLDDAFGPRRGQGLGICVGYDEIDTLEPGIDHVVDGITTCPADTENGNPRPQFADVQFLQVGAQRTTCSVQSGAGRPPSVAGRRSLTAARPVTGKDRSGCPGRAARQEGRRQAGRTIYADIFASTSCGSRNRYPRPHTVSMYSLPFDALASFLRILHIKTSMILISGSSMPP
jgi:hypothetical protein